MAYFLQISNGEMLLKSVLKDEDNEKHICLVSLHEPK